MGNRPSRQRASRRLSLIVGVALLATACVPSTGREPQDAGGPRAATSGSAEPRGTLRIAWPIEPENLHAKVAGAQSGSADFSWVFNSFLTYFDMQGVTHPLLAREIPSQERGDWRINADGTMVTTYRLRENARWHDGAPLTARDFVLGYQVAVDPEMPIRDRLPEALMAGVEATDEHTVVITWLEPYFRANTLSYLQLDPLPSHLFAEKYRTNKANFVFGEEWTAGYIGNGPFRVERWTPGSGLVARANLNWVLGPPRIETLDIRFIPDPRTELANLLAEEVDLINSPAVRGAEAAVARDQLVPAGRGYVRSWQKTIRYLEFQFRDVPNWQRAVTDVRVRHALRQAVDHATLVEALTHGFGSVADAFIVPPDPFFSQVEGAIVKYPYDPARAATLLADAGWTRPRPGAQVASPGGQVLDVEIWSTADGGSEQEALILTDYWKAVGINATINLIPVARQRENELRVSFPAVNGTARTGNLDNFVWTSVNIPTQEARWQGTNRGSFQDTDIDALHKRALATFAPAEQASAVAALHRRMSELLGISPLYYQANVLLARSRLKGPLGEPADSSGMAWNVFEWEVAD